MIFSAPHLAATTEAARAEYLAMPPIRTQLPELTVTADRLDLPEIPAEHRALILYTSGTAARPKGVVHTHASLLNSARSVIPTGFGANTILLAVPVMHSSGLMAGILPGLLARATLVLIPAFDPAVVLDAI